MNRKLSPFWTLFILTGLNLFNYFDRYVLSAVLPSVQNHTVIENQLLDLIRVRALAAGFEYLSALIEESVHDSGPEWLRASQVILVIENYLRSGIRFVYLQLALDKRHEPRPSADENPATGRDQ